MKSVVLLVLSLSLAGCGSSLPSLATPALGTAPPIAFSDEAGAATTLGAQPVVLDFWSPSCGPCKRTIPAILQKKAEIEAKGARLVLAAVLDANESATDARTVLMSWGIEERFVIDRGGAAFKQLGAPDLPAIAILDSRGVLTWVAPDGVTPTDVVSAIP